jgi:hypothetical protein
MLLGSFCFISPQVPWWQIHTQIFQPCAIRSRLHSCLGIMHLPLAHVHLSKCVCFIPLSFQHVFSMAFLISLGNSNRSLY